MTLRYDRHEHVHIEGDFLDDLRWCEPDHWLPQTDRRYLDLCAIKNDLHRLDRDIFLCCQAKPEMARRYEEQKKQAESELETRILALKLTGVRRA